jgi:probable HAF family extracellular repeat protein
MFNPTNPDKVLDNLADPQLTLGDIAYLNDTTLAALTLWMSNPDIAARLDNFETAIARRTRLLALNYLPLAVETLRSTLAAHNDQELNTPFRPDSIKARDYQRRSRETARKAAALLLRLAHFDTRVPTEPDAPSSTKGASGGVVAAADTSTRVTRIRPSPPSSSPVPIPSSVSLRVLRGSSSPDPQPGHALSPPGRASSQEHESQPPQGLPLPWTSAGKNDQGAKAPGHKGPREPSLTKGVTMPLTNSHRQRCLSVHAARLLTTSLPLAASALAGAAQEFTGLGQIPGGTGSAATAISSDGGVVVGIAKTAQGIAHPFRWDPADGIIDLGTFRGGTTAQATGVNSDGSVVVGFGDVADGSTHAFRWTAQDGLVDLGVLSNGTLAEAQAISADGHVIVGLSGDPAGVGNGFQAFRWTQQTGMQGLGVLGTDATSLATGVSADGSVITGTSTDSTGAIGHAFIWTAVTGIQGIGHLAGGSVANAHALSGDGLVAVGIGDSSQGVRAFRWTAQAGMTSLGIVPGALQSTAQCTSGDGSVVGGSCPLTPQVTIASLWTPVTGMIDVNTLLSNAGTDLSGWVLVEVRGVNGDSSIVAGAAVHNGKQEAWISSLPKLCGTADFNCDGDIGTDSDIESFFACLAGNCPRAPCASNADFNGDGDIGTDADIEAFFRVLAGGSC